MLKEAFFVRRGTGDGLAGVSHGLTGDFLGKAKIFDFPGVFDATFKNAKIGGVVDGNAGFLNEVCVKVWERPVDGDGGFAGLTQTLCGGLGEGGVTVAGESAFRSEVCGAGDRVRQDSLAGTVHLDVANKKS